MGTEIVKLQRMIGIVGHAGAGKDTVADLLVRRHGFCRLALADPVRAIVGDMLEEGFEDEQYGLTRYKFRSNKWRAAWDEAKRSEEHVRLLLQDLGCGARKYIGENVWLIALAQDIKESKRPLIVIPDIRFPNEAKWITKAGGELWHVYRKGVGPCNEHLAEGSITDIGLDAKVQIANNGTIAELREVVDHVVRTT